MRTNGSCQRKRKPSRELRAQTGAASFAGLLKACAHREQRDEREHVRRRVEDERERPCDAEERAAGRRSRDPDGGRSRLLHADRRGELRFGHDRANRADLRGREERVARSLGERERRDRPQQRIGGDDERKRPDREGAHHVRRRA